MLTATSYLGKTKRETPRFLFSLMKAFPSRFLGDNFALFNRIISDSTEKTRFSSADADIVFRKTLTQARRCNTGKNSNQFCVFHVSLAIIQWSIRFNFIDKKIKSNF